MNTLDELRESTAHLPLEEAAAVMTRTLKLSATQSEVVGVWAVAWLSIVRRHDAAALERQAFTQAFRDSQEATGEGLTLSDTTPSQPRTVSHDRGAWGDVTLPGLRLLLNAEFALGSGKRVTWGAATIDDHHHRIEYLRAKQRGIEQTIERHKHVAQLLLENNAECLADLFAKAVAA
jgi:hypothetical protein